MRSCLRSGGNTVFRAVLNERTQTSQINLAASVLYRSLALKRDHPLPASPLLSNAFDVSLERASTCPRIEQFDAFAQNNPLAGMPYGLPGLDEREFSTITRWIEAGAPFEGDEPLPANVQQQVQVWETFFNGKSLKQRLMTRYLYEHLFIGNLYFSELGAGGRYYNLVRSRTPPGQPIDIIATRRPYDDPGVARVYYRLQPLRTATGQAAHALRAERGAHGAGRSLFPRRRTRSRRCPPTTGDRLQSVRHLPRTAVTPVTTSCWMKPNSSSWVSSRARCAAARWR